MKDVKIRPSLNLLVNVCWERPKFDLLRVFDQARVALAPFGRNVKIPERKIILLNSREQKKNNFKNGLIFFIPNVKIFRRLPRSKNKELLVKNFWKKLEKKNKNLLVCVDEDVERADAV